MMKIEELEAAELIEKEEIDDNLENNDDEEQD